MGDLQDRGGQLFDCDGSLTEDPNVCCDNSCCAQGVLTSWEVLGYVGSTTGCCLPFAGTFTPDGSSGGCEYYREIIFDDPASLGDCPPTAADFCATYEHNYLTGGVFETAVYYFWIKRIKYGLAFNDGSGTFFSGPNADKNTAFLLQYTIGQVIFNLGTCTESEIEINTLPSWIWLDECFEPFDFVVDYQIILIDDGGPTQMFGCDFQLTPAFT